MNCAPSSYLTPSITSNVSAASAPPARMRAKGAKGAKGVVRLLAAAAAASLAGSVFAQASFVAGGGGAVRKLPEVLSQQQVTNIANTQIQNITGPQIQQILQTQNFANQTINQLLQQQNLTQQDILNIQRAGDVINQTLQNVLVDQRQLGDAVTNVDQRVTNLGMTDAQIAAKLAALQKWVQDELAKLSQGGGGGGADLIPVANCYVQNRPGILGAIYRRVSTGTYTVDLGNFYWTPVNACMAAGGSMNPWVDNGGGAGDPGDGGGGGG